MPFPERMMRNSTTSTTRTSNETIPYVIPPWPQKDLYLPMLALVFGVPLLIILGICFIQQRNRRIQQKQSELLHNRRLSTYSQSGGIYTGARMRI